jgi:hypothetical protein
VEGAAEAEETDGSKIAVTMDAPHLLRREFIKASAPTHDLRPGAQRLRVHGQEHRWRPKGDEHLQAGYKMALLRDFLELLHMFLYDPRRKRRRGEPLLQPLWRAPARGLARRG